ncbi:ABC transporter permease [Streptomyces sp. NPDC013740]|uniref:ABC transporter permease n=1 Tax=Streptomyces sp. NPDC013740 TaxID=3364867 RepID=UPI0036FB40D8
MSTPALKGPYWVTARQYRRTLWVVAGAVALSLAVIGGLRIRDARTPDVHLADGSWAPADESHGYEALRLAMEYTGTALLFLPLLVGAFVAGPLIAREFETGTYRLSLTQSVRPAAWLRAKVLTAGGVAVAATLALLGVYRLGWSRVSGTYLFGWGDRGTYEGTGIVLVGYVLAAVAVGALIGQLVRRTLLAMSVTGLVMGLVMFVLGSLRWSLLGVETVTGPVGRDAAPLSPSGSWLMMDTGMLDAHGNRLPEWTCFARTQNLTDCPPDLGITGQYLDYHPRSHFWPTQLAETGILLALAALALFAAFRVLRARHP